MQFIKKYKNVFIYTFLYLMISLFFLMSVSIVAKAEDIESKKLTYSTTNNYFSYHTNNELNINNLEYYYSEPNIVKADLYDVVVNETGYFKYSYTFSILPISTGEVDVTIKDGKTGLTVYKYHYEITPLYDDVEYCVGCTETKYLYNKIDSTIQYHSDYANITTECTKNSNNKYDYAITIEYNKAMNQIIPIYDNYENVVYNINANISDNHSFGNWITTKQPTTTTYGEKYRECSRCHFKEIMLIEKVVKPIEKPKIDIQNTTISIKNSVYTGSAIKPIPTIKYKGTTLKKDTYYTVTYKNYLNVGLAKATITGKGNYKGSITKTYKILPKGTSFTKVSSSNKSLVLKWTLQKTKMKSSYITGYQVQYSTTKDFSKNNKLITISGYKNSSKTIKNLTKNKTYYVRIRTYKTVGGVKYFSNWSSIKAIKIK